jgi:GTP-binding protein
MIIKYVKVLHFFKNENAKAITFVPMNIKEAIYTGSYVDWDKMNAESLPEFAFAGRSNVGKSSLINFLCNQKHLAHTSSQPGKTQTFNFYKINKLWNLVDLPGYGYAKVSQKMRAEWLQRMMNYFENRVQLKVVCQLIDARIPPQKIDIEFAEAVAKLNNVQLINIFTKADKKLGNKPSANVSAFQKELKEKIKTIPYHFVTSSSDKSGKEIFLKWVAEQIEKK